MGSDRTSVYAQYVLLTDQRDELQQALKNMGIPTAIYYPTPVHKQPVYLGKTVNLPVTDMIADRNLALPFHPYLTESDQSNIIDAVCKFFEK